MAKHKKEEISPETQDEAMMIAKKVQKPGQTKEQTRLIAQGIQKGIADYKKSAKNKQREADKAKKKRQKAAQPKISDAPKAPLSEPKNSAILPWSLLILSWLGFAAYLFTQIK